jgi:hypothetical protein
LFVSPRSSKPYFTSIFGARRDHFWGDQSLKQFEIV